MTRHHDVAAHPDLGLAATAAATIADQQVRNRGTLGGSIAHGDPASDMPAVLLAAEGDDHDPRRGRRARGRGRATSSSTTSRRRSQDGEILTSLTLPALDGYGYAYRKFNRRREDWAMVAVCALVKRAADGSCEDVRIGLTHMGSTPLRATAAEAALRGQPLDARAHRRGRRAGRGGHGPAGRPQRDAGVQAPPRARAVPARADRGGRALAASPGRPADGRAAPAAPLPSPP